MIVRVLAGACLGLLVAAAAGWGLWWARGVEVARARQERDAYERALATCRQSRGELEAALEEQTAAVRRLEQAGRLTQQRLEAAVRAAERREREAALEAGARAHEAEDLRQRLESMSDDDACRAAWAWLAEVTDD